jgi:DNA topoisomerase-2
MAKKIEDKYKELSEVEHILLRPGMWVGSTKTEERDMFLYNTETERMESVTVEYIPAMLKVVDEVISNSCDEFRRKDNMGLTELTVNISQETGQIIIKDNGGIPVVKNKAAGVYHLDFIFGVLRP